jgi:Protein of unknown function (DUF3570)
MMFLIQRPALEPGEIGGQAMAYRANPRKSSWPRRQCLSLALAFMLFLTRVGKTFAQESDIGYRHEFYREDGDRMSIDTDSFRLDAGLTSNLRIQGTYVIDSISGATPIGAPPQRKWPFATYTDLYNRSFSQAYTSQFNQFVSQNQIYVDAGYETFQQMTNQAAQFAAQTAPTIATNSANASYHSLTNNHRPAREAA